MNESGMCMRAVMQKLELQGDKTGERNGKLIGRGLGFCPKNERIDHKVVLTVESTRRRIANCNIRKSGVLECLSLLQSRVLYDRICRHFACRTTKNQFDSVDTASLWLNARTRRSDMQFCLELTIRELPLTPFR